MGKRDLANVAHGTEENFRPIKFGSKHILPDFFKKNSTPANQNWQTRIPFFKIVEITLYHPLVGRLAFSHPLKKRQGIIAHLTGG
jgi:hypothetical protein